MSPEDVDPEEVPAEEEVRRLLAAVGQEPARMPPDVVDRLDAVLADLSDERAGAGSREDQAPVAADLSRRRSRRWPTLLVAAATVSVVALGVDQVLDGTGSGGSGDSATSAGAGAVVEDEGRTRPSPEGSGTEAPSPAEAADPPEHAAKDDGRAGLDGRASSAKALPRLRTESLTADVQRIADFSLAGLSAQDLRRDRRCGTPATDQGEELVGVRLDGEPATLVLGAPENGERRADVYACDAPASPVASTTIEAR